MEKLFVVIALAASSVHAHQVQPPCPANSYWDGYGCRVITPQQPIYSPYPYPWFPGTGFPPPMTHPPFAHHPRFPVQACIQWIPSTTCNQWGHCWNSPPYVPVNRCNAWF